MRSTVISGLWVVYAVMLVWPSHVLGQACCSATSAGDAGVVGRCHYAMVSMSMGVEHGLGYSNGDGGFQGYQSLSSTDAVLTIAGGIRPFDRRFRVGGVAPVRLQYRATDVLDSTAIGVGDLAWSSGFLLLQDPMMGIDSWVPFLEVFVAGTIATGRSPTDSDEFLLADATSTGGSTLSGGLKLVKFATISNALRVSAEYRYHFAHMGEKGANPIELQSGAEWEFRMGWMYEGSIFWSLGVHAQVTIQSPLYLNGEPVNDSDSRKLFTGITFRRSLSFPWWDLNLSAGQNMFLGKNLPRAGVNLSLGVQRNFL